MNNKFKKILNIIIFVIFLFAMTIKVEVVKAETTDHKFSFTAFTCSSLDENNKCKGYKNDGVIEEFDYDNPFVSHGEVIKLGIHYTPGQNKTWDLSTFFNYDKDYVTPVYVNDSLLIEKAEDLNELYIIDSNDITTEAQIGAIVEDGSTLEENRTYLENEEDLYYVYFKVKDVTPSNTFKFTYDLDEDKTNVSADETITSEEIEFEIIDKYTVTYPDGKVIIKNAGDILKLPETWDKESEVISTVTFKYHNDLDDTTSNVTKGYNLSKWTIDETEYNPGDEITINNDIVLEDSYEEEIINAEFPENPKKTGFEFDGWYTEEVDGELVTEYSEEEDITLYAHWSEAITVTVTTPKEVFYVPVGDTFSIPVNDIEKADENFLTVTFKPENGEEDIVRYGYKSYYPNGWLIDDTEYSDNVEITVNDDIILEPNYETIYNYFKYQGDPEMSGGTFLGWNTQEDGTGEYYDISDIGQIRDETNLVLYAIWEVEEVTVSFDSHGAGEIDPVTKMKGVELGDLPEPTKDNNIFDGWYMEDTYQNKVSSKTIATGDMTLHAKWIEDQFPIVFNNKDEVTFDGTNYINTHVRLYNNENWEKDYEVGFTIEEYTPSIQVQQAVFFNSKYEKESIKWPGLVFRRENSGNNFELTQTINNGTKVSKRITGYTIPTNVKIIRIDKVVYYSINDGSLQVLQDMSNFNQQFETEATFGAGLTENNEPMRFLKGKLSNMYIRLGTYEETGTHSVTYPDGTVENYIHNSTLELGSNETIVDPDILGTVTFKYHNGEADTTSSIMETHTANGFNINDVHYDDESTLIVDEDKVITESFKDERVSAEFPENPVKEHYTFIGWFDQEKGGNQYTSYDLEEDITLHAQYSQNMVTISTPHGDIRVPEGSEYPLGTNNISKNSDTYDVTFKYHDDTTDDLGRQVVKNYMKNGWLVNGEHYDDNESFEALVDTTVEPDYIETIIPVEFPSNPVREHYTFDGWYTEEVGGEKVEEYFELEDITLHAQWTGDNQTVITPDGEEEVPYGSEYTLGTNTTPKEDDTYTVTYIYHDDVTGDLEKEVTVQFTPNGWLVNDVHYDDEASFEVTENTVIEPDYIETVIGAEFPSEPSRDNYEFVGWFDAEEDGTEYTEYNEKADITLHARWEITLPTDITIDSEDITLIVGETHQVEVTFTPEGTSDTVTYTNYDEEKISVTEEGLVTGLSKGETTITVGTENTEISKTINVTVLSDKLESNVYVVEDKVRPKENDEDPEITDRIVTKMEIGTTISEFKDNMLNPNEHIKIYDVEGNIVEETDIVKTGQVIKLEYNGQVYDEAVMILKGDINGDGYIDVSDKAEVKNHILEITLLEGYKIYASDITGDGYIDVSDNSKITDYVLGIVDSLNN